MDFAIPQPSVDQLTNEARARANKIEAIEKQLLKLQSEKAGHLIALNCLFDMIKTNLEIHPQQNASLRSAIE